MPSAPLFYLLKAHAVLLLFAAAYFGLLRPLTFFALNRAYLALALVFAAVYPALPVPLLFASVAPLPAALPWVSGLTAVAAGPATATFDWQAVLLWLYGAGAVLLLVRLLVQLAALGQLHRTARPAVAPGGQPYRRLLGAEGPFSFGRAIYLNPDRHPAAELAVVLAHEQAHVRQGHTFDVLLAHAATALFWASPAAWLLRRALLDNLEYLADAATLRTGLDRRTYQYSLLRLGPAGGYALASPFSFLTLKNRVLMMNQPASARLQLLRYLLAGPLVVALALSFSAAQAQTVMPTVVAATPEKPLPTDAAYYVDGKQADAAAVAALDPQAIGSVNVLKGEDAQALTGKTAGAGVILVTTKGNENSPAVLSFNKKHSVALQPASPAKIAGINGAQAYIQKTYPSAKLQAVYEDKNKAGRYVARFEEGGQTKELHFDGQGHPVPN